MDAVRFKEFMSKTHEKDFERAPIFGGVRFSPYKFGIGASITWWPCIPAPGLLLYFGPFSLWLYLARQHGRSTL